MKREGSEANEDLEEEAEAYVEDIIERAHFRVYTYKKSSL